MIPREFWIKFAGYRDTIYKTKPDMRPGGWGDYPDSECIHVREVVPIDWDKVWGELNIDTHTSVKDEIQQLVERALKGEL